MNSDFPLLRRANCRLETMNEGGWKRVLFLVLIPLQPLGRKRTETVAELLHFGKIKLNSAMQFYEYKNTDVVRHQNISLKVGR